MSISYTALEKVKNLPVYITSNEKYVLSEKSEMEIQSQDYKLLGFLNNYAYSYTRGYISKSTLNGLEISSVYVGEEIEHASFAEGLKYFYAYENKNLYCIDEQLNLLWIKALGDTIRSVTTDANGDAYVIYVNSRTIHIILPNGEYLCSMTESDDVYNKCRLYKTYVTEGRGYLYTIGTVYGKNQAPVIASKKDYFMLDHDYYPFLDGDGSVLVLTADTSNNTVSTNGQTYSLYDDYGDEVITDSNLPLYLSVNSATISNDASIQYAEVFIDKYDLRTHTRLSRDILTHVDNVEADDETFYFDNIVVKDDMYYVYANDYLMKVNREMIPIWKFNLSFNSISGNYNRLSHIEYDDTDFSEFLYFCEDLYETNGHSFGKVSISGDLIWKVSFDKNVDDAKFSMCVYKQDIFTASKLNISTMSNYALAVDNNKVLFETNDGNLISVTQNNTEEVYDSKYFQQFQLIGSKIKDGVEEILNIPLMDGVNYVLDYDYVPMLTCEHNNLYHDPSNYQYFRLVADLMESELSDESIMTTMSNMAITTNTGEILRTANTYGAPYVDPVTGNSYFKKYLHGDKHMFYNRILTKKNRLKILTKSSRNILNKKKKEYFKYVYRRFSDVDIIVEFFKQSGILDTLIPKYTDHLIHHTTHMIEAVQEANIPVDYDLKAYKRFEYMYDGDVYPIRVSNTQIYMCKNLPFNKKRNFESIYIDSMANVVANGEMKPFIMFVDGKAIKWSNMTIVRDWYASYIIVSNFRPSTMYEYHVDAILLPCLVRYGEDNNLLSGNYPTFLFDDKGYITEDIDSISIRVEILDPTITEFTQSEFDKNGYIDINTEYDKYASDKNILPFESKRFYPDGKLYLQSQGRNLFTYLKNDVSVLFKTFYYNNANTYISHMNNIPDQEQLKEDIKDSMVSDSNDRLYLNNLHIPFDYRYSRNKTYDTNVAEATKYILNYDVSLFNKYYKDKSNVVSMCFTGKEILDNTNENLGYLMMPRRRKYHLDDYIIMYVNGKLYDYFKEIKYQANMFKIPIFNNISETDNVEIIHYMNINNKYYSTYISTLTPEEEARLVDMPLSDYAKIDLAKIYEDNDYTTSIVNQGLVDDDIDYKNYLDENLRYDNFLLFANGTESDGVFYPAYDDASTVQYPVDFIYRNTFDDDGTYVDTEITLSNKYYRFKKLNFVSKRQFRQMYYNVYTDQNTFELDREFKFCQNIYQYMIFVNGVKLNFDGWTLHTVDTNPNIQSMGIVTTNTLHNGDVLEIIYVPDPYDEIVLKDFTMNDANVVEIDREILEYPFDKELFLIYVNGKKAFNDGIENLSSNKIRFLTEYIDGEPRTSDITICRFIQPDNILKEAFSYKDQWSNIIDEFTTADINRIFK